MFRSPRWRMLPLAAAGLFAAGCINIFPAPKPKTTNSNTTESEPTQVVNAEAVAAVALGKTAEPQAIPHAAKGLYGQSLGEKTIPAEGAPKSAPLRARKSDSLYTLAKPRIEAKKFDFRRPPRPGESREVIAVDWVRTFEGENEAGTSILVRAADGQDRSTSIGIGSDERAGTIALQTVSSFGPFSGGKLPKDVELYLVRTETRYGSDFQRTFKVSNSVILGETQFPITLARDWTEEEIAKLRNAPPKPPKWLTGASTDPGLGEDTEFVGTAPPHRFKKWYSDDGNPLLGFDWRQGNWDKEDCIGALVPVFSGEYPKHQSLNRLIAKPGYAVGGITVKSKVFINGIRVTFMKLKPDGTLDPNDSYESPWAGPFQVGTKEAKLGGDGRKVVGFVDDKAAVLHAVGLTQVQKTGK